MIPRRTLFSLAALVLALHALVLAGASAHSVRPGSAAPPQAFETRTIALAVPVPPASPPTTAAPSATPRPAASARTKPVTKRTRAKLAAGPATAPAPQARPTVEWTLPSEGELLALSASSAPAEPEPGASAEDTQPPVGEAPEMAALSTATMLAKTATTTGAPEVASAAEVASSRSPTTATSNAPVQLPPPARLDFEVTGQAKGFGYHASAELVWQHDATSYHAHQEIKVIFLGSRSQDSVGSVTAHGLQPRRFGDRARSERAAHFDFASGRVTFSANTPAAPIEPGAQDRLSVFLQLASLLAAAPERYPVGTHIAMTTVSARAADVWAFTVQAEQSLELPIGTLRAVPLERLPRREYDQKAQVWLAPSLGYLPVRIRLTEANGDFAELNLRGHEAP